MALFFGAEFPTGLSDRTSFDNMLPIHIIQDNHNRSIAFAKTIIDILLEMIYSFSRGLTIIGNNCQFLLIGP